MEATFVDAYLFGPQTLLAASSVAMHRALRRKCSMDAGDVISDVHASQAHPDWRLPAHHSVSLVVSNNEAGAKGFGKSLHRLGGRLTMGSDLTAVFVWAPWEDNPSIRVCAIGSGKVFTGELAGVAVMNHLRATTSHKKATMGEFIESDMMGPGAISLLATNPSFRSVFARALAVDCAMDIDAATPRPGKLSRSKSRL